MNISNERKRKIFFVAHGYYADSEINNAINSILLLPEPEGVTFCRIWLGQYLTNFNIHITLIKKNGVWLGPFDRLVSDSERNEAYRTARFIN